MLFKKISTQQNFELLVHKILKTKLCHVKALLKRFHLNGDTIGFHPQTQKLELHTKYIVPCESTAEEVSFEW